MMGCPLELADGVADRRHHPVSDADDGVVPVTLALSQRLSSQVESAVEAREIVIPDEKPVVDGEPKPRISCGRLQQVCRSLVSRHGVGCRISFGGDVDRAQYVA